MAVSYAVDLSFSAKTRQIDEAISKLNDVERAAKRVQGSVDGKQFNALGSAVSALPGRFGAAVNGIVDFTSSLKAAQQQAKATAADVALLQAALASKKIQLGAKGGIGGESLKREISDIEGALANAKGSGGAMAIGLGAVATAGVAAAAGIAAVTTSAVRFSDELNRNRQQLTLFTKDTKVTEKIIASLQRTADASSLGLPGLVEATKTLAAYGVEAENAGAATKLLGNIALGDNEKLQRFAVNLGQIASLGKAYTVDLKQFSQAGVPIFVKLAEVTGKSTNEIMRMAEEGKITYPLVIKALQSMTAEGEAFYNGAVTGGTDLNKAIQQMIGSWEKLQDKIGQAATPAVVAAIKGIGDTLDGLLGIVNKVEAAFKGLPGVISKIGPAVDALKGPFKGAFDFLAGQLEGIARYIKETPALQFLLGKAGDQLPGLAAGLLPGIGPGIATAMGINKAIRGQAPGQQKGNAAEDAKEQARLKAEADKKAAATAEAEKLKLAVETAKKIAELNLSTERSLIDARISYEEQVADFRRQQIERIADMERQINDERRSEEFKLSQLRADVASKQRLGQIDQQILDAPIGSNTTALKAARAIEIDRNESAKKRAEIEFNATTRRIELERRLSDFKRESERQMGEMQLNYTRQTDGILRQAGRSVGDLLRKAALDAKAIMESINIPTAGAGGGGNATIASIADSSLNANAKAWLAVIRSAEGTAGPNGYRTMFGGGLFSDMSRHPDRVIRSGGYASAAAGAYQFMPDTWRGVGGGAMTPVRQDRAAMALALRRGVDLSSAAFTPQNVARLAPEWASLPTMAGKSYYGQPYKSFQNLQRVFAASSGAPAAPALPAANNIVPTGSIPSTSPGLEKANAELDRLNAQDRLLQKKQAELDLTVQIRDAANGIKADQESQLKSSTDRNAVEMRTLELMRSGVKPELAAQQAANEQMIRDSAQGLEIARSRAEAAVAEKDLTAETKAERQKILDSINNQIAAQPSLLGQLNSEAQQTQALADQRAAMDQAKSDASGISSTITGGLKDAIKAAVSGGDVKAALSNMLASLGEKFLDMAMRPIEQMLTNSLQQMFSPQALATNANTQALFQATAAIYGLTAAMSSQSGIAAAGGISGLFSGGSLFGSLGSMFSGTSSGLGAAASSIGFNPLAFTSGLSFFADGGIVTSPTNAIIGEAGPEAVIPLNKLGEAMQRFSPANAESSKAAVGSSGDGSGGSDAPPVLNITTGPVLAFEGKNYVSREDFQMGLHQAAMQGAALGEKRTLGRMQNSPGVRRRLGMA
jgi:tape measure domain-containing protein